MAASVKLGEPIILASLLERRKAACELEARVTELEQRMAEVDKSENP